jgi:hypothetical protein
MRSFVLISIVAAAVATANPVVLTFINEFGFEDDSLGWVELHAEPPDGEAVDMTGWLLMTSTSACTFAYTIPYDGFLVVDSASLAGGEYGHGTFRLNLAGDSIWVVPDWNHMEYSDEVEFPLLPADWRRAPMPPSGGSAAVCNSSDGWYQTINWYIDSTPTREMENDDYSTVTGIVTWAPERNFHDVSVTLSGPMGGSVSGVASSGQSYQDIGLGAGRYSATAHGWPGNVIVSYPESVDVGYNHVVSGISFDFDPPGVEEGQRPTVCGSRPTATVLRGLPPGATAFDAMGRRVVNPRPGVYFVRSEPSAASRQPSAVAVRKVVVQR